MGLYSPEDVLRLVRLAWFPGDINYIKDLFGDVPDPEVPDRKPTPDPSKTGTVLTEYVDMRSALRFNEDTFELEVNRAGLIDIELQCLFLAVVIDVDMEEAGKILQMHPALVERNARRSLLKISKAMNKIKRKRR